MVPLIGGLWRRAKICFICLCHEGMVGKNLLTGPKLESKTDHPGGTPPIQSKDGSSIVLHEMAIRIPFPIKQNMDHYLSKFYVVFLYLCQIFLRWWYLWLDNAICIDLRWNCSLTSLLILLIQNNISDGLFSDFGTCKELYITPLHIWVCAFYKDMDHIYSL